MTANELAEQLDEYAGNSGYSHNDYADSMSQAATMLRQQQAEIEALKQIIDANNLNQNIGQFVKPTNEPVAWINKVTFQYLTELGYSAKVYSKRSDGDIPLYTHPAELTDEEILKMAADKFHYSEYKLVIEFARAILRKARNNG